MTPTDKPLLCYHVSGSDPEDDMIEFARSSIEAKRYWANEHGDGDRCITGISATRCKGWDKYAPGPVPYLEMVESGWRVQCFGCYRTIDEDSILERLDEDEHGNLTYPMEPYEPVAGRIWCSKECHDRDMLDQRRDKTLRQRAERVAIAALLKLHPDVTICNGKYSTYVCVERYDGRRLISEVRIQFETPGMKHGGGVFIVTDEVWRKSKLEVHTQRAAWIFDAWPVKRAPLAERARVVSIMMAKGDMPGMLYLSNPGVKPYAE